ncbi:multicopy suppressor of BFA (Brefeldin A) [Microbotryomycetes sp. JL201]|nr:multicopy suppressor of BFA (Brefeldin A) [Microbotryomycetes sp. JL201]
MGAVVVGAPDVAPTKKQLQARKQQQAAALSTTPRGQDPAAVVVDSKKDDDRQSGKPDKAAYDAEQDALRKQIDVLQQKQTEVKNKIASVSGRGPNQERKQALRQELDQLRAEQARLKGGRGKTLDQVKTMQDNVGKRIKDLQAAKAKAPFKSVAEVDNQIKSLERQVESGTMKLVDEKKALAEISNLKKQRKTVESFGEQQAAIDAEKKKIDEIRASLDDPEAKAISDKFNEVRAELDKINKAQDEASKGRDALYDERNAISKELDGLFAKKKESVAAFRAANDKYYQKMNEDRAKRLERQRAERAAIEESKRNEVNQRLLEEARAPAFEREIEDCRTLITALQKRVGIAPTHEMNGSGSSSLLDRKSIAGVPELEVRKVDTEAPKGAVALKKKGEQEEESWGGFGGGSKKSKKGGNKKQTLTAAVEDADTKKDESLNLPFTTLSALLTLGIAAPLTVNEIPRAIEQLELKLKYFRDNQDRVTKEKIAAAEKRIADAESKTQSNGSITAATESNGQADAAEETKADSVEA